MSKRQFRRSRRLPPRRLRPRVLAPDEARLRLLAEHSRDIFMALRFPEGRCEYISPSAELLFGMSPQEFYRDPDAVMRCVAPAWRAQVQAWIDAIPLGALPEELEFQVVDRTGSLRWLRLRHVYAPTTDGAAWLLQGVATDITELRDSEAYFRQLIEAWPDQVALSVNLDAGRHEYVSPSMERVMGYAPQEFYDDPGLGMRVVAPQWQELAHRWIADLKNGMAESSYEFELVHKNGEHRWIHQVGVLRPRSPGQDLVVQFSFRDITERIRAEGALRKSERMSRLLLESMRDGVWAVDRDQKTIFVNEHLASMLGYSVPELRARQPLDLVEGMQRQHALERLLERRLGLSGSGDYQVRCKDGRLRQVHVSSSPILDEAGEFDGLVCTVADLSERKHMEEELRRNQARFEALYELSRLTSATEAQMAGFALREAQRLTGSSAGVLFFVSAEGTELRPLAWSGDLKAGGPGVLPADGDSPWARVFASQQPHIINNGGPFDDFPLLGRSEPGRFLCVPARDGARTAAILGLAGKGEEYTQDDSLQVSLLMDGMWRIVRTRRDEERIRASLREKEALLREVHHRVKNNLQVVTSLLDMVGRRLPDSDARRGMEEVRAKVQAMSLVHAQLHGEGAAAADASAGRGIDLERYVLALFRQLRDLYSGDMDLSLEVQLGGLALGLDQAVPLGLALNEALVNVFKHGRRKDGPGWVSVSARREAGGKVLIEVRDDGPGLPAGLSPERARSLGLKLMFGLVRNQLGGELTVENRPGGVLVRILFLPNIVC